MSYQLHVPDIFPDISVKQEVGWTPERGGTFMRERNCIAPTKIQTLDLPTCNVHTIRVQVSVVERFVKVFLWVTYNTGDQMFYCEENFYVKYMIISMTTVII